MREGRAVNLGSTQYTTKNKADLSCTELFLPKKSQPGQKSQRARLRYSYCSYFFYTNICNRALVHRVNLDIVKPSSVLRTSQQAGQQHGIDLHVPVDGERSRLSNDLHTGITFSESTPRGKRSDPDRSETVKENKPSAALDEACRS